MINIENSQFPVDDKFIDKLYNDAIHESSSKNDPGIFFIQLNIEYLPFKLIISKIKAIFIEYINFVLLREKRDWKKINHVQFLGQNALKGDHLSKFEAYFQAIPTK